IARMASCASGRIELIIAILGIDELSEEDRVTVQRARRIERFSTPSSRDSTWNGKPAPSTYLHRQLDITTPTPYVDISSFGR
ncbi:MAG: hypothetical protein ACLP56_22265, partial [Candidatus Sulfotelmatobacter sp.]